ncbi:triosephosphate isomerase [Talaromyces stipitatus ATCC 10500]|uniref:Triosephosphate isomerase n=1 Tax=Talaromyces stipitatus (strain ATCC 10500 / CBS 375.48 / QM 6759 / NRRL 1006) TaxID=441959 RepID=B8M8U2_TALSN|nr:triosephosphate isomerase [Talaromyces stipitatus ATCC 10500]EED20605.1 triosephosphate isomerase [Talaromyces stipitatus ATCC 10500]
MQNLDLMFQKLIVFAQITARPHCLRSTVLRLYTRQLGPALQVKGSDINLGRPEDRTYTNQAENPRRKKKRKKERMATTVSYPVLPQKLLIISLKMYFTPSRTLQYLRDLLDPKSEIVLAKNRSKLLLALIPDFLTIYPCAEIIRKWESELLDTTKTEKLPPPFLLGGQDSFWEDLGAFTGEVSPLALKEIGASLVELGHAERRDMFGETNEITGKKAAAVSRQGLIPLVCIGELSAPGQVASEAVGLAVRECETQIHAVLRALPDHAPVIFAYEPVWAIGQPQPAGVEHVAAVVAGIRAVIGKREGDVRVLYGGSAGPGLWSQGGLGKAVDGMFLGRFAHQVEGVRKVVREVEETFVVA